ncbi:MAG TPA: hypothetical protein PLC42_01400 [Parachlamydiaceae bacterium]|nr:hypothetical protein [Parachlamydiaceae bacterium]
MLAIHYGKVVLQNVAGIPEALEFSEVQDKFRKLVLKWLPVNDHVKESLKAANAFFAPLRLGSSVVTIYKNGSLKKASGFNLKEVSTVLVSFVQAIDLTTNLNNWQLVTIEKIVGFVKSVDVFKFLQNVNLKTENVLDKLRLFKDGFIFTNTVISLWEDRSKSVVNNSGDGLQLDDKLLFKRVADVFKLTVVGLSLANSLTSFGTLSCDTYFGKVTSGKVIEGLSYFSTATAFFKAVHSVSKTA